MTGSAELPAHKRFTSRTTAHLQELFPHLSPFYSISIPYFSPPLSFPLHPPLPLPLLTSSLPSILPSSSPTRLFLPSLPFLSQLTENPVVMGMSMLKTIILASTLDVTFIGCSGLQSTLPRLAEEQRSIFDIIKKMITSLRKKSQNVHEFTHCAYIARTHAYIYSTFGGKFMCIL